ncbi:amino acid ABC transporter substrate-binding protein, PAAT family [Duganella sp. CF458]|uniref:hypothetical protein n=1 Tax=Duganella sp. CF458 TaxID=1884368 RepID=UPI0008F0CF60|nr:hypothetical protein [Duganella sp. CF458]SFG02652.1 amino acid ABC transporter substrate-binding protein, PAAT family [Duganella sp. CF458]
MDRRAWILQSLLPAAMCCLLAPVRAHDGPATAVVYPRYFSILDTSKGFDWIVLRAALEKTAAKYGPFTLAQSQAPFSVPRMLQELSRPGGTVNVIARATHRDLETQFQPIRIPIDRGLMGLRLLLVRKSDLPRFARVRTLADLRHLSAGQGKGWVDASVLSAAGISVVESPRPGSLFGMLEAGRFDFFPRALDEAPREYDVISKSHTEIVIEPTLMLRYPLPRYFFVRRDAEGAKLAERIKTGLEMMLKDGSLVALFHQHKDPLIERAQIGKRRIIELQNPALPPETPLQRSELWYRP